MPLYGPMGGRKSRRQRERSLRGGGASSPYKRTKKRKWKRSQQPSGVGSFSDDSDYMFGEGVLSNHFGYFSRRKAKKKTAERKKRKMSKMFERAKGPKTSGPSEPPKGEGLLHDHYVEHASLSSKGRTTGTVHTSHDESDDFVERNYPSDIMRMHKEGVINDVDLHSIDSSVSDHLHKTKQGGENLRKATSNVKSDVAAGVKSGRRDIERNPGGTLRRKPLQKRKAREGLIEGIVRLGRLFGRGRGGHSSEFHEFGVGPKSSQKKRSGAFNRKRPPLPDIPDIPNTNESKGKQAKAQADARRAMGLSPKSLASSMKDIGEEKVASKEAKHERTSRNKRWYWLHQRDPYRQSEFSNKGDGPETLDVRGDATSASGYSRKMDLKLRREVESIPPKRRMTKEEEKAISDEYHYRYTPPGVIYSLKNMPRKYISDLKTGKRQRPKGKLIPHSEFNQSGMNWYPDEAFKKPQRSNFWELFGDFGKDLIAKVAGTGPYAKGQPLHHKHIDIHGGIARPGGRGAVAYKVPGKPNTTRYIRSPEEISYNIRQPHGPGASEEYNFPKGKSPVGKSREEKAAAQSHGGVPRIGSRIGESRKARAARKKPESREAEARVQTQSPITEADRKLARRRANLAKLGMEEKQEESGTLGAAMKKSGIIPRTVVRTAKEKKSGLTRKQRKALKKQRRKAATKRGRTAAEQRAKKLIADRKKRKPDEPKKPKGPDIQTSEFVGFFEFAADMDIHMRKLRPGILKQGGRGKKMMQRDMHGFQDRGVVERPRDNYRSAYKESEGKKAHTLGSRNFWEFMADGPKRREKLELRAPSVADTNILKRRTKSKTGKTKEDVSAEQTGRRMRQEADPRFAKLKGKKKKKKEDSGESQLTFFGMMYEFVGGRGSVKRGKGRNRRATPGHIIRKTKGRTKRKKITPGAARRGEIQAAKAGGHQPRRSGSTLGTAGVEKQIKAIANNPKLTKSQKKRRIERVWQGVHGGSVRTKKLSALQRMKLDMGVDTRSASKYKSSEFQDVAGGGILDKLPIASAIASTVEAKKGRATGRRDAIRDAIRRRNAPNMGGRASRQQGGGSQTPAVLSPLTPPTMRPAGSNPDISGGDVYTGWRPRP